jgi:hypothetical protein
MFNLTQHNTTAVQKQEGVKDYQFDRELLTFVEIPSTRKMIACARKLAAIVVASGETQAMIGGAPFFMSILESVLLDHDIEPIYAFSVRISEDKTDSNGVMVKTSQFQHLGFVRPYK